MTRKIKIAELPEFDMAAHLPDEQAIAEGRVTPAWTALLDFQIERTRRLILSGAPLVHQLPGRFGWEIRLTVQGGLRILERIRQVRGDVFARRPKLGTRDWLLLATRSFRM